MQVRVFERYIPLILTLTCRTIGEIRTATPWMAEHEDYL